MHNLQLTEDQEMIVDTVRKFVADVVAPKAQELDEHRTFVREQFSGLAELGVFGLCVGEAAGGVGMGLLPFVAALEAVGSHSSSLARLWIGQVQAALALEAAGAAISAKCSPVRSPRRSSAPSTAWCSTAARCAASAGWCPRGPRPACSSSQPSRTVCRCWSSCAGASPSAAR
jgi:hypothetical protein